ncbi:MAG: Holliday junction branch migration protein RuvA [Candidatus Woesebacteria bacterium]
MIGYLSGISRITSGSFLVLCNGVGYTVLVTKSVHATTRSGEEIELYIYSHIKEDCFDLYGFATEAEKELFLQLIDVDGIGPKTALGIMDRGRESIIKAVQSADVSFFSSVSRVGKKSAQKIIIDLKNKLGGSEDLDLSEPTGKLAEIVEALVTLGFDENQSIKTAKSLEIGDMRVEDAIKKAIQKLTSSLH